jgi:hypothetical protein
MRKDFGNSEMISIGKISVVAAAAMLAGINFAAADATTQGNQHKCWDNIAKQVREQSTRAGQQASTGTEVGQVHGKPGEGSGSTTAKDQGSNTGMPSIMNHPGTSPQSNASPAKRPQQAEGLPDCNT